MIRTSKQARILSRLLCTIAFGGAVLVGCGDTDINEGNDHPEGVALKRSSLGRETEPSYEHIDELGASNRAFALDVYRQLESVNDDNLFFSPFSISQALAMTYAGARGVTKSEMQSVLHVTVDDASLHEAWNATNLTLEGRGKGPGEAEDATFELNVANSLWMENTFEVESNFLDVLSVNYDTGVFGVDFIGDPGTSRMAINDWVADKTNDRIKDLLPKTAISSDTRLVLTNAVYFNANWETAFNPALTKKASFTPLTGDPVSVDTMHANLDSRFGEGPGYKAASIPYRASGLDMLVILPDAGTFNEFEAAFDETQLTAITSSLAGADVVLSMPKFTFSSALSVRDTLRTLGMNAAFDDADFSGIHPTADLVISDVIHQAFVAVDEEGTEAAAATAVIIKDVSAPPTKPLDLNRPFIFAIRDTGTGEILFLGRVTKP